MILSKLSEGFNQIRSAVGNQKKIVIADIMQNNRDAWSGLWLLLNPLTSYGIGDKSLDKITGKGVTKSYYSLDSMLYELNAKHGISDQDIRNVQWFIQQNNQYEQLIRGMITKSITLGVTAKTVNKVAGYSYIPEFSCMLANKYYEHMDAVKGQFVLTEKFDGIRCLCVIEDDNIRFYSRQGKQIEGLVQIEEDIRKIVHNKGIDIVLDGQLIISDRDGMPSKEQYKQTTKIVMSDGEKYGITYHVFDIVDYEGFVDRECKLLYYQRRQKLSTIIGEGNDHVQIVPILYSGSDTTVIQSYVDHERQIGHQGVMINLVNEVYQYKRTNALLKCKVMRDADLMVIGVNEGTGKYANTLGALNVVYKGNIVGVGSGLSDSIRYDIWSNPDAYIGKIATIQYFEQTQDEEGKLSIRFPVFKCFRQDKDTESYN